MRSRLWPIILGITVVAGCMNSTVEEEPPVAKAPPLQPGIVSMPENNPFFPKVDESKDASGSTTPASPEAPADLPRGPDEYRVELDTTKGKVVIAVHRDWSPFGADRFYQLVQSQYFDGVKFYRAVPGFMVQFGISGDPATSAAWRDRQIPDDPVVKSNRRGTITYAKPGMPHARTTQVFINYADNPSLDGQGFSPFGEVIEGMDVVDSFNQQYGEETTKYQQQIHEKGNAFLDQAFPGLDSIKTARIIEEKPSTPANEAADKAAAGPVDARTPANAESPAASDAGSDADVGSDAGKQQ